MPHGLLLIDKPTGATSHDVVARARRLLGTREVGHAGTLDPLATGLLILCVGRATRLSEYLLGEDKTYWAAIKLGERTNTDDAEGEVVERRAVRVDRAELERARAQFSGEILQVPPQFSAISKGGVRAYALARKGESVDLAARRVTIRAFEWIGADDWPAGAPPALIEARVTCSSGTYIRALARDLGEALGCGAHLAALRRTRVGAFTVDEASGLDALDPPAALAALLPMERAVAAFPRIDLDEEQTRRLMNGQRVSLNRASAADSARLCRVYDAAAQFVAVGEIDAAGVALRPVKVLGA